MSKPNVDRLCLGLQSTRIKERTEAVVALDSITDTRLSPKEVFAIALKCFSLVELETPLVTKGTTSASEKRVEDTTSSLKRIVSACVGRVGLTSSVPTLRSAQFIRILRKIEDHFFLESGEILAPSSYNFLQLYNTILSKRPILDHMGTEDWQNAFNFATMIAFRSLRNDIFPANASVCTELTSSLFKTMTLLMTTDPKTGVSIVYLPTLNIANCEKLFLLMLEVTEKHIRSRNCILYAFQIINKLVITSISEDSQFAFKVAVLGLKLALEYLQEGLSDLQAQILIFLNLTESRSLLEHYSDYGLTMKITYGQSSTPQSSFLEKEEKLISYYLANIIATLSNVAKDSVHWAKSVIDFKAPVSSPKRTSFFALNSIIYNTEITEWNRKTWLSLSALVHSLHIYFVRKKVGIDLEKTNTEPRFKKQKVDLALQSLRTSIDVLNYCQSILLTSRITKKDKILGTQLIIFYYQLYPHEAQSVESNQRDNFEDNSLSVTLFEEVTPLDTLQLISKNRTDSKLYYLAVKSYLDVSFGSLNSIVSIFNTAMLEISNEEYGELACEVVSQIIRTSSDATLQALARPLFKHTLEDVLAQVTIKGPHMYSQGSFSFWHSIIILVRLRNISLKYSLEENIFVWFLDKWNLFFGYVKTNAIKNSIQSKSQQIVTISKDIEFSKFQITKTHQWLPIQRVQNFMLWLMGIREGLHSKEDMIVFVSQFDDYLILLNDFSKLRDNLLNGSKGELFTLKLRQKEETLLTKDNAQILKQKSMQHYFSLIEDFKSLSDSFTDNNECKDLEILIFQWLLFYLKVEFALEDDTEVSRNGDILLVKYFELTEEYTTNFKNGNKLCGILCAEEWDVIDHLITNVTRKNTQYKVYQDDVIEKLLNSTRPIKIFQGENAPEDPNGNSIIEYNGVSVIDAVKPNNLVVLLSLVYIKSIASRSFEDSTFDLLNRHVLSSDSQICNLYAMLKIIDKLVQKEDVTNIKSLGRTVGLIALQNPVTDRSEISFVIAGHFLRRTLKCRDAEFASDWEDIKDWLEACHKQKLINTFRSRQEYALFLAEMEVEKLRDNSVLFLKYKKQKLTSCESEIREFNSYPNVLISSIGSEVGEMIRSRSEKSVLVYSTFFKSFDQPQRSKESFATYTSFLGEVALKNENLTCPIVFNVIEYCEYELCKPLICKFVLHLSKLLKFNSAKELFGVIRVGLLKLWVTYKFGIAKFPYDAFGYHTLNDFYNYNASQLVPILVSSFEKFEECEEILQQIARVKEIELESIIVDGFSSIIVLSYAKNGIKNNIHKNLKLLLGSRYSDLIRSQLLLITLDIFKYLDVSDEEKISKIWSLECKKPYSVSESDRRHFTENLEIFTISVTSGFELLKSIIAKVHLTYSQFWTIPNLYFCTRRLTALLNPKVNNIHTIRRIKLVLTHNTNLKCRELSLLLADSLAPYLLESSMLSREIQNIWVRNCFDDDEKWDCSKSGNRNDILIKIISSLIRQKRNRLDHSVLDELYDSLEACIGSQLEDKFSCILMGAVKKLFKLPSPVSIAEIEMVLLNQEEFQKLTEIGSFEDVAVIVDFVFPTSHERINPMDFSNEIDFYENLALHLKKLDVQALTLQSSFNSWCSDVLASLYTHGIFRDQKLNNFNDQVDKFTINISKEDILEVILQQLVDLLKTSAIPTQACIESVLGILLGKLASNQDELLTFLPFSLLEKFTSYIAPMDYKMGIILQRDMQDMESSIQMKAVVDSKKDSKSWAVTLFIDLLADLGAITSATSAFAILAIQCEAFCEMVLPFIVSLYIETVGITSIPYVYSKLKELDLENENLYELYLKIVLAIRVGSRNEGAMMSELYSKLDLSPYIKFALMKNSPKAALLLYEDQFEKNLLSEIPDADLELLRTVYNEIGYDDLKYGLPADSSLNSILRNIIGDNSDSRTPFMLLSGKYDAELSFGRNVRESEVKSRGVHEVMQKSGVLGISRLLQKDHNLPTQSQYETSWRLCSWDLPEAGSLGTEDEILYIVLKRISEAKDILLEPFYSTNLIFARLFQENQMSSLSDMSCKESRDSLQSWLSSLSSVKSISSICEDNGSYEESKLVKFADVTKWIHEVDLPIFEPMLMSRRNVFQIFAQKSDDSATKQNNVLCLIFETVRLLKVFKGLGEHQKLLNSAIYLNELVKLKFIEEKVNDNVESLSKFFLSTALWEMGQEKTAISMMKELQNNSIKLPFKSLSISKNLIRATLVDWMTLARHHEPGTIFSEYVVPIYDSKDVFESPEEQSIICEKLGKFCEEQNRKNDDGITKLKRLIRFRQKEIEELKSLYSSSGIKADEKKSIHRYYVKLKAQYQTEVCELETLLKQKDVLAEYSVEFYLKSISNEKTRDSKIDKFFSLWLEFSDKNSLNLLIREDLLTLPAHLLVEWAPQLISRLAEIDSEFQKTLNILIEKLCQRHPYHSLYILFSLAKHESSAKMNPSSTTAAKKIWSKLKTAINGPKMIKEIEKFCEESINLAKYKSSKGKAILLDTMGAGYSWFLEDLPKIPPPTIRLKIDLTSEYNSVPLLDHIDRKIVIATSGLSLPKIATFYLNNGLKHKILFKHGSDDLRQDSIMEQVFEKVNCMFKLNIETRKRKLSVRTYMAVPLGPNDGLIEFVSNSVAFIDVIKPYHKRDAISADKAREMMKNVQTKSRDVRRKTYEQITKSIKPVLREFFMDTFLTAESWFESRIMYSKGVATSSIVGFILGLGDRHCNNILLDKSTGEPIHIDLGVAFDQGKLLPIPETVPFRLTRDIVDGFGITGTDGVFSLSCEHTFRVLRQNREHIIAILDVLRWDPLYSWSISPLRKSRLQKGEGGKVDLQKPDEGSEATRSISKVNDKLGGSLSVESTVNELIQEATDQKNLSLIYCGWCPFY